MTLLVHSKGGGGEIKNSLLCNMVKLQVYQFKKHAEIPISYPFMIHLAIYQNSKLVNKSEILPKLWCPGS